MRGALKIAGREFDAILAQTHFVGGSLDNPTSNLYLMEPGKKENCETWWEADTLGAYHFIDGTYYTITATPTGDKLFVKPYAGKTGAFQIGPGARDLENLTVRGSLRSPFAAVAIGSTEKGEGPSPSPVREWQVPVGDYTADDLGIHFGPLLMTISDNYHSDGKRQDWNRQRKFAITIREDRPCVLDFSNKPEVMFALPAKNSVFKPGDEVNVHAVLIDPVLDIMIRRLKDTRQKQEIDVGDGNKEASGIEKSLDPTVTIADPDGKIVAQGPMPFG